MVGKLVVAIVFCLTFVFGGYGPDKVINFSGYIDVHFKERHLFYWFFESRNDPTNDPLIIWLTGGPGCSSMLALMVENGPYHVLKNESLELNPYSWNTKSNIMWIDNPSGTGFSYDDNAVIDGVYDEDEIADDLYEFMQIFLKENTKYQKNEFFVTGESYAGHYVPHFAHRVYEGNNNLQPDDIIINLKGLAIGDGLVDPYHQYSQYAPYAYDNNLVDRAQYDIMKDFLPLCETEIYFCETNDTLSYVECINSYDMCNLVEIEPVTSTGVNPYDIREKCQVEPLCYDFSQVTTFYQEPSVVKALNATTEKEWIDCNRFVELDLVFAGDWMKNFNQDIPPMLEDGIRVLVYHGEYDFICNWYGGYNWVKKLDWKYNEEWNRAPNVTWEVNNDIAGYNVTSHGLTFLKVLNAGHLVPMDQPQNALAMIEQFTINGGF